MINLKKQLLLTKVKIFLFLIVNLFLALSTITYLFNIGHSISTKYAPLVDAAMEIKLEATTAHLWFEEILSGDREEDINAVRQGIKNAIWYANAMINGGKNSEGTYLALENEYLESKIKHVLLKLYEFEDMTHQRYMNKNSSIPRDEYDVLYDTIFEEFITEADLVETKLQEIISQELKTYELIYNIVFIAAMLSIISASLLLYFYQKEKLKSSYILEQEVIHDALTELHNRRYYNEIIGKELMRSKRDKSFFTFCILDIDFFKTYNDTYGHQEGDKALQAVAKVLKETLNRGGDYCFRLGGEEFGFIFTGQSAEESLKYTKNICKKIENLCIPHSKNEASSYLTASFGVLHINMECTDINEEIIYLEADKALYQAKESGRNCVILNEYHSPIKST